MLDDSDIVFSYSGLISQNILVQLASVAKNDILRLESSKNSKVNRIYEVIVEMLHNVLSYSNSRYEREPGVYESKGAILIAKDKDRDDFSISCVNSIDQYQKERVKTKLDTINSLDKTQRKEFFKGQLSKSADTMQRGAGLGFFEMSRRSKKSLDYEFFNIDGSEYFALTVTV